MNTIKVTKLFWAWEEEKEIAYLEKMARKGWLLIDINLLTYHFLQSQAGNYTYQMDYSSKSFMVNEEKKAFLKECHWHHAASRMGWHYYRGKNEEISGNDLLTDYESFSEKYKALRKTFLVLAIVNLTSSINIIIQTVSMDSSLNVFFIPNLAVTLLLSYGIFNIFKKLRKYKLNLY